jgi:predicted amidophosphoribosyltransferase
MPFISFRLSVVSNKYERRRLKNRASRIQRESQTIEVMISLYCRHQHRAQDLCPDCRELLAYAQKRLEKCPFQEGKTACGKCPVHCYKPEMRARVRQVMRYSGPRMIYSHPVTAIRHLIDGRRKKPEKR